MSRGNLTFSKTFNESNKALPWNTIPISLLKFNLSKSFISEEDLPSYLISPESILYNPKRHFKKTVLPDPLWPIIKFVFPLSKREFISDKTSLSSNFFDIDFTSIIMQVVVV